MGVFEKVINLTIKKKQVSSVQIYKILFLKPSNNRKKTKNPLKPDENLKIFLEIFKNIWFLSHSSGIN